MSHWLAHIWLSTRSVPSSVIFFTRSLPSARPFTCTSSSAFQSNRRISEAWVLLGMVRSMGHTML